MTVHRTVGWKLRRAAMVRSDAAAALTNSPVQRDPSSQSLGSNQPQVNLAHARGMNFGGKDSSRLPQNHSQAWVSLRIKRIRTFRTHHITNGHRATRKLFAKANNEAAEVT